MEVSSSSSCSSLLSVHSLAPHRVFNTSVHRRISNYRNSTAISSNCCSSSFRLSSSYYGSPVYYKSVKGNRFALRSSRSQPIVCGVFERFTERAIKAVMFSQREAKALGNDLVFTQHLLLGLIAEDRSPDGFLSSGINIDMAREAVRSIWIGEGDSTESVGPADATSSPAMSATNIPFSQSTKRVFEAAVDYSKSMDYHFISPEHLAVGLFTVDDGSATRVLKRLGANANHLAAVAITRLQGEMAKDGRVLSTESKKGQDKSKSGKTSVDATSGKTKDKSALAQFCVDLTARAADGLIDPVIGREIEVERIIQILCRRSKNNPILLGEAGVGKTAIAEGLAINIAQGNIPVFLMTKRIMSLDVGLLISGAKERGELEARITSLIKEIKKSGNIILFIDEVHTIVGSGTVGRGNKGSGLDMANLLKPSLGRAELQCIASTTMDEYRSHFENDAALARRFQPVLISEPSQEDAVRILIGLRDKYEAHHKCKYTLEAISAAVGLSARYIPDRHLPDKAIDLIDEAGSKARMEAYKRKKQDQASVLSMSPDDYWQEIRSVEAMHQVARSSNLENDAGTFMLEDDSALSLEPAISDDDEAVMVGADKVAAVASLWSGIPVEQLTADERLLLVGLEELLAKRVVGQTEAVTAISRAVKRSRVGLNSPNRPIATMLFCGPTGVGKTELTKALAEAYFGSEGAMLRLDMSEYMERHTVSKLIGSPPGYVGFGEGGMLTESIRKKPFTVVLLDEIEKAHPDIFNILLQIFEDGHLTDSQGRRVSFKNALIVMTSNVGSTAIAKGGNRSFGFVFDNDDDNGSKSYAGLKSLVMEELKSYFRPELLNRIDEVVVFRSLEKTEMMEILSMMLREVKERLTSLGIGLEVTKATMELICEQGYDRAYGARPLRRAVTQIVEDLLSESFLSGDFKTGDTAVIDLDDSGNPFVVNKSTPNIHTSDTTSSYL